MAIEYNDVTKIRFVPMDRLVITFEGAEDAYALSLPETGSLATIAGILRGPTTKGGMRMVGYKWGITWYLAENDYEQKKAFLHLLATGVIYDVGLFLTALPEQSAGGSLVAQFGHRFDRGEGEDPVIMIDDVEGSWSWETVEDTIRTRVKIELVGVMSLDVLTLPDDDPLRLFTNQTGWS